MKSFNTDTMIKKISWSQSLWCFKVWVTRDWAIYSTGHQNLFRFKLITFIKRIPTSKHLWHFHQTPVKWICSRKNIFFAKDWWLEKLLSYSCRIWVSWFTSTIIWVWEENNSDTYRRGNVLWFNISSCSTM